MSHWRNKVVVVTGGSVGLGRAIAAAFAKQGANVVIASRNGGTLESAAEEIRHILDNTGGQVLAIPTDVTSQEQVDRLFAQTIERFGRLDVLVNNAGRSARGQILDTTPEEFDRLWELNFLGVVRCTRAAAPYLLKTSGHLVNIGSLAAKTAARYVGAYPASKFALAAYTQQLRLELGPQGLHVLLVCPGPIIRDNGAPVRHEYDTAGLPDSARKPGAGVKLGSIRADKLADEILRACESRRLELVYPRKARVLFVLTQLSARMGDWLLRRWT